MPKYKDSPEVRAAKKERKEKLREFLQLLDVEDYSDLRSVFKEMVGEVLENGLEAELDDELGYSEYDYRNKETENSRNGYSRKSVKTSAGPVEIAVPRDRNGEFEPQIIKKNETSLKGDIEEKILAAIRHTRPVTILIFIPLECVYTKFEEELFFFLNCKPYQCGNLTFFRRLKLFCPSGDCLLVICQFIKSAHFLFHGIKKQQGRDDLAE